MKLITLSVGLITALAIPVLARAESRLELHCDQDCVASVVQAAGADPENENLDALATYVTLENPNTHVRVNVVKKSDGTLDGTASNPDTHTSVSFDSLTLKIELTDADGQKKSTDQIRHPVLGDLPSHVEMNQRGFGMDRAVNDSKVSAPAKPDTNPPSSTGTGTGNTVKERTGSNSRTGN